MMSKKYSTKKQNGGNYNMKNNYRVFITTAIDINSIYNSLKNAISERIEAQKRQEQLWSIIKRTRTNHEKEMDRIDQQIGNATHKVNKVISQLCQYKKTHKAMNLAYEYLKKEMERISKIIDSKTRLANDVERGRATYITSAGRTITDTTEQRKYIKKKTEQYYKLQNWLKYVSRYLAY